MPWNAERGGEQVSCALTWSLPGRSRDSSQLPGVGRLRHPRQAPTSSAHCHAPWPDFPSFSHLRTGRGLKIIRRPQHTKYVEAFKSGGLLAFHWIFIQTRRGQTKSPETGSPLGKHALPSSQNYFHTIFSQTRKAQAFGGFCFSQLLQKTHKIQKRKFVAALSSFPG